MCLNTVTLVGSGSDTLKIRSRMIHSGFTTLLGMDRIKNIYYFFIQLAWAQCFIALFVQYSQSNLPPLRPPFKLFCGSCPISCEGTYLSCCSCSHSTELWSFTRMHMGAMFGVAWAFWELPEQLWRDLPKLLQLFTEDGAVILHPDAHGRNVWYGFMAAVRTAVKGLT